MKQVILMRNLEDEIRNSLKGAEELLDGDVDGCMVVFTYSDGTATLVSEANLDLADVMSACVQVQQQQVETLWSEDYEEQ